MFQEFNPSDITLKGYAANLIAEKSRAIRTGDYTEYKNMIKRYYKGLCSEASAKLSSFITL